MSSRLLVVKTGSAEPGVREQRGDFEDWIASGMGYARNDLVVVNVLEGMELPTAADVSGVVITGSAAFVSERETWSVLTEEWLVPVVEAGTPVLGICYGHQLLAQALGGRVDRNPLGREMGTTSVDLSLAVGIADPLLGHLPERVDFQVTHVESVIELPEGAVRLGTSAVDEHHAFSWGPRAWGLQFHPEFDAEVMRGYVSVRADVLRDEGFDPERMVREARDSPHGPAVLRRFGEIVRGE